MYLLKIPFCSERRTSVHCFQCHRSWYLAVFFVCQFLQPVLTWVYRYLFGGALLKLPAFYEYLPFHMPQILTTDAYSRLYSRNQQGQDAIYANGGNFFGQWEVGGA